MSGKMLRAVLASHDARIRFDIAVALISVIPALILGLMYSLRQVYEHDLGAYAFVAPFTVVLMLLGYTLLGKYPVIVLKLRKYLEDMVGGNLPAEILLETEENDIQAIEKCLNSILMQLKQRVREMEMEKVRLELQLCQAQKLRAIGTLASGIAHEVNSPIQYVSDNVRFLSRASGDVFGLLNAYREWFNAVATNGNGPASKRVRDLEARVDIAFLEKEAPLAIRQSLEGLARASEITRAMKDFALMTGEDEKVAADLNHAIERTVVVTRNEWKHVAEVRLDLDPELPLVPCVPGDVKQVLVNLIINATHAIADASSETRNEKGVITIQTRRADEGVTIRVADTGGGVPESVRGRIFEPFFTTRKNGKGTGQGLAISRSLIEKKHGGTISFVTETGRGTTFIVCLPLHGGIRNTSQQEAES